MFQPYWPAGEGSFGTLVREVAYGKKSFLFLFLGDDPGLQKLVASRREIRPFAIEGNSMGGVKGGMN